MITKVRKTKTRNGIVRLVEFRPQVDAGQALGKITFHLDDQFVGAKANEDGKFKVNRVLVGKYKVTIEGKGVPAKFASEDVSPLTVEVKVGANTFDFDLQ